MEKKGVDMNFSMLSGHDQAFLNLYSYRLVLGN